ASGPGDSLTVTGGSFASLVYDATGAGAGTLSLGANSIKFTGLEPVTVTSPAATVQIDVDPANAVAGAITTTLADAAGANMIVSFTSGLESLTFVTPT